jgi:DNA-binding transcriptional MerR regulator
LSCFFGEILQASGVGERTLQRWVEAGVIQALGQGPGGRGNYRMFGVHEIVVAAMLRPLADAGFPLGRLWQLSRILRHAMAQWPSRRKTTDVLPQRYQELGRAVERALAGVGTNFAVFAITADMPADAVGKKQDDSPEVNMYPGALSVETGESPAFDPTPFLGEAAEAFAAWHGHPAPSPPVMITLDLAPLRGLVDDLLPD